MCSGINVDYLQVQLFYSRQVIIFAVRLQESEWECQAVFLCWSEPFFSCKLVAMSSSTFPFVVWFSFWPMKILKSIRPVMTFKSGHFWNHLVTLQQLHPLADYSWHPLLLSTQHMATLAWNLSSKPSPVCVSLLMQSIHHWLQILNM